MQYVLEPLAILTAGVPSFFFKTAYIRYLTTGRVVISFLEINYLIFSFSEAQMKYEVLGGKEAKQTNRNCLMLENSSSSCLTSFALIHFFSLRHCESQHKA